MPKIVRSKKTPSPGPSPAPAPAPPRVTGPRVPPEVRNRTKVLLTVADGKIDWQAMTPDSRRQFEEMFKDPKFLAQFGLSAKKTGWQPDQVKHIYDGLGMLNQTIAALFLRWPAAAVAVLGFTNEEKDLLAEPTAELANRYSTEFLQKHQALAIWGACFMSVMQAKMLQASTIAREDRDRKLKAIRDQGKAGLARDVASTPPASTPPASVASRTRIVVQGPPAGNGHASPSDVAMSLEDLPDPLEVAQAPGVPTVDDIAGPI